MASHDVLSKCDRCNKDFKKQKYKTCNDCLSKIKEYQNKNKEKLTKANAAWRKANKEKLIDKCKEWRANNPDKVKQYCRRYFDKKSSTPSYRLNKAKQDAKSRNLEFTLTLDEYSKLIELSCYYCDGYFGKVTKGTGLDRIDSNLGYTIDNVVSCCATCNHLKSNVFTQDETKIAVKAIIAYRVQQLALVPIQS